MSALAEYFNQMYGNELDDLPVADFTRTIPYYSGCRCGWGIIDRDQLYKGGQLVAIRDRCRNADCQLENTKLIDSVAYRNKATETEWTFDTHGGVEP